MSPSTSPPSDPTSQGNGHSQGGAPRNLRSSPPLEGGYPQFTGQAGRRPSHYTFTDPNAASAASFSADVEYSLSSPNLVPSVTGHGARGSIQRGESGMGVAGRRDGRPSMDNAGTLDPCLMGEPWFPAPAVASPIAFEGEQLPELVQPTTLERGRSFPQSQGSSVDSNRNAMTTSFRPRRMGTEDSTPSAQSPLRQQLRRQSESWLNRDGDSTGTHDTLHVSTKEEPKGTPYEEESDEDVCVPAPSIAYGLDFEGLAEVIGAGGPDAKDSWKKYTDPPEPPRFVFYSEKTGALRADSLEAMAIPPSGGPVIDILRNGPFWIDVTEPTHSEMVAFSRLFGIHPLTTEDIQTEETREKCEMFLNYYFICIRTFDNDEYSGLYMQPINVFIVVLRECVLSFHCKAVEHTDNVLKRIQQLKSYGLHITPDWINYALIDDITDGFMPLLKFIELEVDSIDDLVLILKESEQSDMLRRIGHARKKVMQLLRLLSTKADVLKTVIKRCGERLPADSETSLYLGDIQDHAITMVQNLSHYEKTLARAHSNYLAQISIEITVASNRTNDVVMKMTAMASILLPLNVVTGLFGMNVTVPGADNESLVWFFGIVVGMIGIAGAVYWWARNHKLV